MKQIITEDTIDAVAERLGSSEDQFEQAVEQLRVEQPLLLALIFSESFELFTQSEREYILFLLLVIWGAVKEHNPERPPVTEKELSEAEEKNWEQLQGVQAQLFRERLDVFFEHYGQEDLLAFVEDAILAAGEEDIITKEGREPIFVSLKSVIDSLTG